MTDQERSLLQDLRNELTRVATVQEGIKDTCERLEEKIDNLPVANGRDALKSAGVAGAGGGSVVGALVLLAKALGWP